MKRVTVAVAAATALQLAVPSPILAAEKLAPDDIKQTFGTGKAFTSETPGGSILALTLSPDGTAKAVPKGKKSGQTGTWRVSDKGYCSTWAKSTEKCYTVQKNGDHYDVVNEKGAVVAHWKPPSA